MLTFLSSPKPFLGNADIIQRNSIRSWKAVHPDIEVLIYGEGEGVVEACREMGVCHVPDVPCSPSGVPYFNGIVEHARINAKYDLQCYLNCDILLTKGILEAVKAVSFQRYLLVGQRIDLMQGVEINITTGAWQDTLNNLVKQGKAVLHTPAGMDYFMFTRGMWDSLAPLVVGRGGYDNALLLYCFRNNIPVINATLAIMAIHQFHDYAHVKGGEETVMMGEDAQNNLRLHNNYRRRPNSAYAPWLLKDGKVVINTIQRDWLFKLEHKVRFDMKMERVSLALRILWKIATSLGIIKIKQIGIQDVLCS